MSQVENIKYDKAPAYTSDTDDDDRNKDIIMKTRFSSSYNKNFNVDDYEVFEKEYVEEKARESIENYAEEWLDSLRERSWYNYKEALIMNFVKLDIEKYIEMLIKRYGIEQHAGLEGDYEEVEYEGEKYYVINTGDIPW